MEYTQNHTKLKIKYIQNYFNFCLKIFDITYIYSMDTLQEFKTSNFEDMTVESLRKIEKELLELQKIRRKQYIKPQQKQHFQPLIDQYIKPLQKQYIEPIKIALKELRKHLPKQKYFLFDGKRYGPFKSVSEFRKKYPMVQEN